MFALMAEVFDEDHTELSADYVDQLLARPDFWALGVYVGERIVGGLTAHTLPMTTSERAEIFLYDIAVHDDHQGQGLGRRLIDDLRARARAAGISTVFVPADRDDTHALDFYRALGASAAAVTMFEFGAD